LHKDDKFLEESVCWNRASVPVSIIRARDEIAEHHGGRSIPRSSAQKVVPAV